MNDVIINLFDAAGNLLATEVTHDMDLIGVTESGWYWFEDLRPGEYVVGEVSPPGWMQTSPGEPGAPEPHFVSLAAGQRVEKLDFGNHLPPLGSIHGQKWDDVNGDGVWDAGEPPMNDVIINLFDAAGNLLATEVTHDMDLIGVTESGWYWFEDLRPGEYVVGEVSPPGWMQTSPGAPEPHFVTLAAGERVEGKDFGNYRLPTTGEDDQFEDNDTINTATSLTGGEFPDLIALDGDDDWYVVEVCADGNLRVTLQFAHVLGDIDLEVYDAAGNLIDSSTSTGDGEALVLSGLSPGPYFIRVYLFGGEAEGNNYDLLVDPCAQIGGDYQFEENDSLTSAASLLAPAFFPGLIVRIDDEDWFKVEVCQDGTLGVSLSLVHAQGDIDLEIYDAVGNLLAESASTENREEVVLTGLGAGTYFIRVFLFGGDFNGYELSVLVQCRSSIHGQKWNDLNGNGFWDDNEPGLNGWTIELWDGFTGQLVAIPNNPQVTHEVDLNGDGFIDPQLEQGWFWFDVEPGDYQVHEVQQPGWVMTFPLPAGFHSFSVGADHKVEGIYFGNRQPPVGGFIHGQKWNDLNGDGFWDTGEPGLNGWTIELRDGFSGLLLDTQVTHEVDLDQIGTIEPHEQGWYWFEGLPPGEYEVREAPRQAWIQTWPPEFGTYTVLVTENQAVDGVDFGNTQELDFFTNSEGQFTLNTPTGPVDVQLTGPTMVAVGIRPDGGTNNTVVNTAGEFDVVDTEILSMNLTGDVPGIGLVNMRLNPNRPSLGQIVEGNNIIPGILDVPPFNPSGGNADSFFDVFFEIDIAGVGVLHNEEPKQMVGIITRKPPGEGDTYQGPGTIPLFDANGNLATGFSLGPTSHTPNPGTPTGGAIHGQKWNDLNGDGVHDPDEPGLNGWTIELEAEGITFVELLETQVTHSMDLNNDGVIDPVTEQGLYWFVGLLPDTYFVNELLQDGWTPSFPTLSYTVTLAPGQILEGLDFGNSQSASIHGQKWNDLNGDGVHDADEPGLNGWTIELVDLEEGQDVTDTQITHDMDLNNDGVIDPVTEQGWYWFVDLLPSEYDVLEAPQDGWVQTFPDLDFYAVTLAAGEIVEGLDFGNEQVGSIHGQKWNDLNGDGVHDPDEPGLNGWTIQLVDLEAGQDVEDTQITHDMDLNNDGVIDPVTERGLYWFKDLLPGEYDVLEVPQDGWVQTFPDLVFHAATLAVGDIVEGLDFGNEQVGSIHGQKWNDLNGDGVHDPDEPGLNGWTIQLVDLEAGGDVEDTQITHDMDLNNDGVIDPVTERGLYWFVDLLEGEYDVLEVPQDGWVQTFPDLVFHAATLAVGDIVEGLDFGNYQPGEQFLSLEPGEAFNLAGGSHTVSAFVTNEVLIPVPGVEVFFEVVAGPNAGASGSAITDVNGEARFTYTDLAATGGTDQIQASAGPNILGQIVFKTWTWISELQPASATNPVVTSHTVTAILTGEGGVGAPNGVPVNLDVLSGPNAGVSGTVVTGGLIGFADFTYTDTAAQSGDTDEIGAWIGASPTFAGASVLDSAIVTKTWVAETGKTTVEGVEAILKVQSDEFSSHVEISIELVSLDLTSPHPLDGQITAFEVFMGGAPVSPPIDFFDGALVTGQLALESYLPEPGDPLPDQSAMIHLLDAQGNNLGLVPVTVPDQTVFADILDDFVELFDSEFILISILDAPLGQVVLLDICNFSSGDKEFMVFDPSGNPIAGPILLLPSFPDECTRVLILVDLPGTYTLEVFDVATGLPVFIGPFIAGVL